ncbi:sulfur carrier protein ThiS [Crocinitomicaceae bacterium CZZ-1]|uniref:Sulfur carrier protein ThiS n=1 Tax=Taishania pollutisoli TaxID=2766479 RepID=A0A8J6PEA0_9FLAO|nr:sulfur carrier protein ThiS [Taishania pollutisoli]MBC9812290.1 sulfur carrier protein ThiS [Taishania pollutisoli]MBX2950268.1 sulfur carrier protein ThiS [Crocinitomicaceae bacterium]
MKLIVNNQEKKYDQLTLSVQELLDLEFPQRQNGIAVAIDDSIVPKSNWTSTLLTENATVLIITATQGG